jgi:hypothetical protein
MFPFLNQKLDFSREREQHQVIQSALDALLMDFRLAKADTSKIDPGPLTVAMVALKEPLVSSTIGLVCSRADALLSSLISTRRWHT